MRDLEERISRVWNPDVQPLVAEAYRSYTTGASRACILLTWGAVCADLVEKVSRLAEDGENEAVAVAQKIEQARTQTGAQAVKSLQDVERTLLDTAEKLELLDFVEKRELERLREDRHLCAHPSLRPHGELFAPTSEYARAHLASALDGLLTHPPVQGRQVLQRFRDYVAEPGFAASPDYLTHAFFDRVKPTARKRLVDLAAKHAVLELESPELLDAADLADRMARCLHAFANRDRTLVRDGVAKAVERLSGQPADTQVRAVARLGDLDVFWGALDEPTLAHVSSRIQGLASLDRQLTEDERRVLSLVAVDDISKALPALRATFDGLEEFEVSKVIECRPAAFFTPFLEGMLKEAKGFRHAEGITQRAILPSAPYLTLGQLKKILDEWAANNQCREAGDMVQHAVTLYHATAHLRPDDHDAWSAFVAKVQEHEPPPAYYSYEKLAKLVTP
jgi:hypothetical protein